MFFCLIHILWFIKEKLLNCKCGNDRLLNFDTIKSLNYMLSVVNVDLDYTRRTNTE